VTRYFIASILLVAAVVGFLAVSDARRTQRELSRQLGDKALALADALETASRNAIRGNALVEEMIAQRLLDNARLVDELLLTRPADPGWLERLSAMNRLQRVDLLDRDGRPYANPGPPAMMGRGTGMGMPRTGASAGMGHGMMGPSPEATRAPATGERPPSEEARAERHRAMMMYMWGRRWARPTPDEGLPAAIRDQRFWRGSVFGVAVGARSFPGIIAVRADADYVLNFGKEIGVQQHVEELAGRPGIEAVALLDEELGVLAHSDPSQVGRREADPALRDALREGRTLTRLVSSEGTRRALEVVKPLPLGGERTGLLRIGVSTEAMDQAWERDRLRAILLGLAVLGLGIVGMAAIFYTQHRHLRETRRLEAEIERRERLSTLGGMAAGVAHEIRNPLNAVSMGLQRLRGEFETAQDDEYRRLLDLIQGEVRRLNGIVEEFLSLARPLTLDLRATAVADLVAEVTGLVEAEATGAGVKIERGLPADLPPVRADRDRLKQVLLNLSLNALEAMPGGGTLRLAASAARQALTITVSDTGTGIAPEMRGRLFEPYVTSKARGVGLGLAIARRIVEAHGGRITAESEPGQGTRFRIALPLGGPADG
jgi:signal transduction histidine kinase